MAKKTPEEIFREMQAKALAAYEGSPLADPQFRSDVAANAKALPGKVAQGAMNAGNKLGNAMEGNPLAGMSPEAQQALLGGIDAGYPIADQIGSPLRDAGRALKQSIYDLRTGGQPAAPYPDVGQLMTNNANAINANMQPQGMMPRPGQTSVLENQIIAELQQLGVPITPENVQQYMAMKARMQGAGQQIQQGAQQGVNWARGLLQ